MMPTTVSTASVSTASVPTICVSFVVPAHNEERLLPGALQAIRSAADSCRIKYEIVVADDASTDRTAHIATEFGARVIAVQHRKISATRNSGARAALGDLIVFVDADTLINAGVLGRAIEAITDGAVGGGAMVRFDGRIPLYARASIPVLTGLMRVLRLAAGCFVFCTRAAFDAAGGFDERLFGAEEIAFSAALKKVGRFVILRETVMSSGRKLRTYSGFEVLAIMGRFAMGGRRMIECRDQMGLWYDPRREDPEPTNSPLS
ncbi:MAG: glycosyltransferase [Pseudomonadota bacterium]|nr:glycosyltransferase [Pseudomonadota bacterium]